MECQIRGRRESLVTLAGRVLCDASAIPLLTTNINGLDGVVITRTGVGQYLATIRSDSTGRKYPRILYANPQLAIATDDVKCKVIAISNSAGTVTFETIAGAAAADIAGVELLFFAIVQNSSVGNAYGA